MQMVMNIHTNSQNDKFGSKFLKSQIVMALASWRLWQQGEKRAIRTIWTREESIIGHGKRHRALINTRWGASKEGKITAVEAQVYIDAGAYNFASNIVAKVLYVSVAGPYGHQLRQAVPCIRTRRLPPSTRTFCTRETV